MSALVEPRADSADDGDVHTIVATESSGADDVVPAEQRTELVAAESLPVPPAPVDARTDFGAHFEAHYQRLVAQLYAITLDSGQAHDVVQDAYARAWRRWPTVGRSNDPAGWVRSVAVRSTFRSWRGVLARIGLGGSARTETGGDPRTAAMLDGLRRLPAPERRAIVLTYMAGCSLEEIATIEQASIHTLQARLSRGRRMLTEHLAGDLPVVLGPPVVPDPQAAVGVDSSTGDEVDGGEQGREQR